MIELPPRPPRLRRRAVAVWSEPVTIPTYPVPPPDRNPLFLEKRVYQGSSGRVYPLPVTDRVADTAEPLGWEAVHLENTFLRVMILPGIGGRIHVVQDRRTGYDLFYRQNVIKPALVGLLGPWISGGVEFNWPQHHRPTTFMPLDWAIEELPDGGATVWCSEHEPMERMKGMHGVTLHPDSALLEVRARLENRTPLTQTFLWWANVGVQVHDEYEAFFPPDVRWVADHAKRAVSSFPIARGRYYGVDYGARSARDADLRWYRNIPVPTSYMITGTEGDFFGGYDHAAGEGYVHIADHRSSPGKKLWTWGDHPFGYAWDRELTDADGPYVELMAGVFTDNQPDFSFLGPGEVRESSQAWYPLRSIGPAHAADREVAVHLSRSGRSTRVGVVTSRPRRRCLIRVETPSGVLLERRRDVAPDRPFMAEVELPLGAAFSTVELIVTHGEEELIRHQPRRPRRGPPPQPATEPPAPADIASADELYLTGLHLRQYRHATRSPEAYFRELLARDPGDSRANVAMGEWHLRRGELPAAERHLRAAIERVTVRNPNPRDAEAWYLLGVVLRAKEGRRGADEAFGKAAWDERYAAASTLARAELAAAGGDIEGALELLASARRVGARSSSVAGSTAALLRRSGRAAEARAVADAALAEDPLDARAIHELLLLGATERPLPGGAQTALDVAHDEVRAGLRDEALDVLERAIAAEPTLGDAALLHYTAAWIADALGDRRRARSHGRKARRGSADHIFPARLEDIVVLGAAIDRDPTDARAPAALGNLFYDRRRYDEAIAMWHRAALLDPSLATVQRNLGIAEFNVRGRPDQALRAYRRAARLAPDDARVVYELDQLRKRIGHAPSDRLRALEAAPGIHARRDDLTIEFVALLNHAGRHEEAIAVLERRRFHPWEGGEGLVVGQWTVAHKESARRALRERRVDEALASARRAMAIPPNLGEDRHLLSEDNELQLVLARCLVSAGERGEACSWLTHASRRQGDPDAPETAAAYWRAVALRALGDDAAADDVLAQLRAAADERAGSDGRIPYFATSLPTMLLFDDDLGERARIDAAYLHGLERLGRGDRRGARRRFRRVIAARPDDLEAALRLAEMDRRERHWPAGLRL